MSTELEKLRKEIEDIDNQILELLHRRLKVSAKIGEIKRRTGREVTDAKREEYVKTYWLEKARYLGIPESMVNLILPILFSYSKLYQISPGEKEESRNSGIRGDVTLTYFTSHHLRSQCCYNGKEFRES
jgi:chorismate mutase (EC 5.4.99.5)/prephenate dehydrogenase (EC 1.3.1.12)